MDLKGVLQPEQACFFVTLHSAGEPGAFEAHPDWRSYVEALWRRVMADFPEIDGAEFNVNGRSLHALLFVSRKADVEARNLLETALEAFRGASEGEWAAYLEGRDLEQEGALWEGEAELREIEQGEELAKLREFLVQKMLGGEELSDLGLEDEDGLWDDPGG